MNHSASEEYNNGDESGWTSYLDQSNTTQHRTYSGNVNKNYRRKKGTTKHYSHKEQQEQEDDLSMMSDASSGPPHFNDDDQDDCFCEENGVSSYSNSFVSRKSEKKKNGKKKCSKQHNHMIDDTASSPVPGFHKNDLRDGLSGGSTQFMGKSGLQKHFVGMFGSNYEMPNSKDSGKF